MEEAQPDTAQRSGKVRGTTLRDSPIEYNTMEEVQLWKDKREILGQEDDINMQLNHARRAAHQQAQGLV